MPKLTETPEYRELRKLLVAAREYAGLTQSGVAEQLGRTQSFVSKYESGERGLDVLEFVRVCAVLGVKPEVALRSLRR